MRTVGVIFLVLIVAAPVAVGREDHPQAVNAARAREKAVTSADFTLKFVEFIAKDAVSSHVIAPYKSKSAVPAADTTLESTNRLIIDGVKLRYEDNHPTFLMPVGALLKRSKVSVYDGNLVRTFQPAQNPPYEDFPAGIIDLDLLVGGFRSPFLTPITTTLRGTVKPIAPYPIDQLKRTGASLPIDGSLCEEYVAGSLMAPTSLWLDTQKDYVLRRVNQMRQVNQMQQNRPGRQTGVTYLSHQTDITYRRDDVCGWIPAAWVNNRFSPAGTVTQSLKVEVAEVRLNSRHSAGEFEMTFPPATVVTDNRVHQEFIVQSDGTMRSKRQPTVVAVQPGDHWYRRNWWLIVGVVGIVLLPLVVRHARRKWLATT